MIVAGLLSSLVNEVVEPGSVCRASDIDCGELIRAQHGNVAKAACSLTSEYVRFKGLKGSFEPAEPAARVCLIAAWRKLEQFE
jgi:hypothetical protein